MDVNKWACAECEGTGWKNELQGTWQGPEMLPAPCSKCCGEPTPIYISTRAGVRNEYGDVLGEPDAGSVKRKQPCGTFKGRPVMGFWTAIKRGIVSIDYRMMGCPCCNDFNPQYKTKPN